MIDKDRPGAALEVDFNQSADGIFGVAGMGVEVAWMTERHERKQVVGDSYSTISRLATSRWPKLTESVCLRFVNVCGDAVFNQAQLPVLIAELQAEAALQESTKDHEHIEKVIRLVQGAAGRTHNYIAFLGD